MPKARSHGVKFAPLFVAAALALAACGGADVKYDAAQDIRAFVEAVQTGDSATFEKHVDRPALRAAVAAELQQALREQGAGGLGAMLGQGAVEGAADRLITPQAFQFVAEQGGMKRTPSAAEIATQLKVLDGDRVCLQAKDACVLTFASSGDVWKLVAVDAEGLQISRGPGGGAPMDQTWPAR